MTHYQLFYVSRALASEEDVQAILDVSRSKNALVGLSGALLFTGGHFAQFLEGPRAAVDAAMSRIGADCRHDSVRVSMQREAAVRRFATWSMASVYNIGVDDLLEQMLADPASLEELRFTRLIDMMFKDVA